MEETRFIIWQIVKPKETYFMNDQMEVDVDKLRNDREYWDKFCERLKTHHSAIVKIINII